MTGGSWAREFAEKAKDVPLDKAAIDRLLKVQTLKTLDYFHRNCDKNNPLIYKNWHQMYHSHSDPNNKHRYHTFVKSRADKGLSVPPPMPESSEAQEAAGKPTRKSSKKVEDPRMCGADAYDRKALLPFEYARANIDGSCDDFVTAKRAILDRSNRRTQRLRKRLDDLDQRLAVYVEASRKGQQTNTHTTKFHWHSEQNLRMMRNGLF